MALIPHINGIDSIRKQHVGRAKAAGTQGHVLPFGERFPLPDDSFSADKRYLWAAFTDIASPIP